MNTPWIYAMILVGGLALACLATLLLGRAARKERVMLAAENDKIGRLSLDQARTVATKVIANPMIFRSTRASSPLLTDESLGAITHEFFETYERIESLNGAVVVGRGEIRRSEYDRRFVRIGRSDYVDVATRPTEDAIFEIDGSEAGTSFEQQSDPNIYHWVVRVASDFEHEQVHNKRWSP